MLTDAEYARFRELVRAETGIALGEQRRDMLQARLGRRLRALGLASFRDYLEVLERREGSADERRAFINAVTTNETSFFREVHHFEYLKESWLPALGPEPAPLRVWSAACSSGEEPYSIAMTLLEALPAPAFRILASDINTDVVAFAEEAVYPRARVAGIPPPRLRRFFLRGRGAAADQVRVRDEVRARVTFRCANLLADRWPVRGDLDVIFCRNAMIYFDAATRARLVERFVDVLRPAGLLVLGHAESVMGTARRLTAVGHTIYRKEPS